MSWSGILLPFKSPCSGSFFTTFFLGRVFLIDSIFSNKVFSRFSRLFNCSKTFVSDDMIYFRLKADKSQGNRVRACPPKADLDI